MCVYVRVCACACMCVCVYVRVCAYMCVCAYVRVRICACANMWVYVRECARVFQNTHVQSSHNALRYNVRNVRNALPLFYLSLPGTSLRQLGNRGLACVNKSDAITISYNFTLPLSCLTITYFFNAYRIYISHIACYPHLA